MNNDRSSENDIMSDSGIHSLHHCVSTFSNFTQSSAALPNRLNPFDQNSAFSTSTQSSEALPNRLNGPYDQNSAFSASTQSSEALPDHRFGPNDQEELDWIVRRPKGERKKSEDPKSALGRSRAQAFRHFFLFHAIPLAGVIALIVMNVQGWYFGRMSISWIPWLQFVAKLHELLMQASIGMVTLAYLQSLLGQERSIPFGALFSHHQISQVSYLWSPEFYAAVTTPSFHIILRIGFLLYIPTTVLLATVIGPSAAIAMQPRFLNFTVPDQAYSINVNRSSFYPDSFLTPVPLTPSNSSASASRGHDSSTEWENLQRLPTIDSSQDIELGLQIKYVPVDTTILNIPAMPSLYSVDIVNDYQAARQLYIQYAPNSTFASIQHFSFAEAMNDAMSSFTLDWLLPIFLSNQAETVFSSITIPQPVVSVLCNLNSIAGENDTRPIQFPDRYIVGCGDGCTSARPPALNAGWKMTNYTGISRTDIWAAMKDSGEGRIVWVDDIPIKGPTGKALGAIIIQSQPCKTGSNNETFLTTAACVIASTWTNATTTSKFNSSFSSQKYTTQSNLNTSSFTSPSLWSQPPITLSALWASSLTTRQTPPQNLSIASSLLQSLPMTKHICPTNGTFQPPPSEETKNTPITPNFFPQPEESERPFMHEALLASLIANGISHAADNVYISPFNGRDAQGNSLYTNPRTEGDTQDHAPRIILIFQGWVEGYGMSMDGAPIKTAITILTLYCIHVGVYILYTFISGRSSRTWGSVSGIVALAMNSKPTEVLKNTSMSIEKMETFRYMVRIRKVENQKGMELVFDHGARA